MSSDVPVQSSLSAFWWAKGHPPADPKESCTGKTILITGANTGLGFEAAKKFAALGVSSLILGVRSIGRGKAAKIEIEKITGCKPDVISVVPLDMSSYDSVESFVHTVSTNHSKIDAVVLNAGLASNAFGLGPEGWEMSLQVNAISTAYLAILLLPMLRRTGGFNGYPAHLEIVSSSGHGDVKIQDLRDEKSLLSKANSKNNFNSTAQYNVTKLFGMWAMEEIAAKTDPSMVVVLASCPGLCRSNLGRDFDVVSRSLDRLFKRIFARTSEEGSRTLVSGTLVDRRGHGGFWTHDRVAVAGKLVSSEEGKKLRQQFWDELLKVLSERNNNVTSILEG